MIDAVDTMVFMRSPLRDVCAGGATEADSPTSILLSLWRSAPGATAGITAAFLETSLAAREVARLICSRPADLVKFMIDLNQ